MIWNGRVLLLSQWRLEDATLHGSYFETAFADFVAWRDWNCPDRTVANCFGMGALRAADGAFLLGVMASHTVNAGRIYFPAGTPDPADIVDGRVDLAGNVTRELAEETGLTPDDVDVAPGWHAVLAGASIAMMRIVHARQSACELRTRILEHLARERQPELADIRIVRSPSDLDAMMPDFVTAYLAHVWR
jgi:8-oxo-dGTP pyrophosphatase MutT (NUDIX family)